MIKSSDLSKRENEVVELLLRGMSNKQIAHSLGISASTVEFHLKNVYAKFGVHSRTEVILKLGKSIGAIEAKPQESIVEIKSEADNTRENFSFKELEMRKRILYYFLTGLLFGAVYWGYLNVTAGFFGEINTNMEPGAVSGMTLWVLMSVMFLVVFGVWLIPTIARCV
ncbi:MAG: helix-turn-helix transcriptional regulator [Anaerolineales bacterium]|nr:helix-turn-helix transcriptional regulator [Anaerolineales bacterium]